MSGSRKRDSLGLLKGAGRTSKDGEDLAVKAREQDRAEMCMNDVRDDVTVEL